MSYKPRREGHYMSLMGFWLRGDRYITCNVPGCMRVRRMRTLKPLIHNGRKSRQ